MADDEKVKAVFTLVQSDLDEREEDYREGLKGELDKKYNDHLLGNAGRINGSESKKRINDNMNS